MGGRGGIGVPGPLNHDPFRALSQHDVPSCVPYRELSRRDAGRPDRAPAEEQLGAREPDDCARLLRAPARPSRTTKGTLERSEAW
jgi:hypothetical protein